MPWGGILGREALADGITRHELRRWYRTIFRGVYIPKSTTPTLYDRAVGAWLASNRRGVLSGVVASALHGAKFVDADHPIDIIDHERRRQRGLVIHMDRIADDEVTSVSGLPSPRRRGQPSTWADSWRDTTRSPVSMR